ncbi:MAG: Hsp20/alpha crystallin family protein [candidate division WOR-3 bacterium]
MPRNLMLWDPFREIASLREDMDRIFDSFFGRLPERERKEGIWLPLVDIEETADEILVRAEIPGLKKEDIKVSVVGNTLTLSGERKYEAEEKGKTFHRIERAYGKFYRNISLPAEVDNNKVKAQYKDGVLTINLPKAEQARRKEIEIDVK